jgi:hypothetical protein
LRNPAPCTTFLINEGIYIEDQKNLHKEKNSARPTSSKHTFIKTPTLQNDAQKNDAQRMTQKRKTTKVKKVINCFTKTQKND